LCGNLEPVEKYVRANLVEPMVAASNWERNDLKGSNKTSLVKLKNFAGDWKSVKSAIWLF